MTRMWRGGRDRTYTQDGGGHSMGSVDKGRQLGSYNGGRKRHRKYGSGVGGPGKTRERGRPVTGGDRSETKTVEGATH